MNDILTVVVLGLATASIYAVAASGLVVTYTTSGIFNFAHGAVAMFTAFVYWQLSSPAAWDLPVPLALVLAIGVFAPVLGLFIERVLMRGLAGATPITRIVVPIGLLVVLIQGAIVLWPPATVNARLPRFFDGNTIRIGEVVVEYHQLVVLVTAVVVAVGLRVILYGTRTGTAMRAVVDSRDLAALNGLNPNRASQMSWALGCALAGLAGVLIAPIISLDQVQLTLLVINAYAAAMVGRLRSLPLTALGAVILGLLREFVARYQSDLPGWINVDTVPVLMLFVVLLVVRQDREVLFTAKTSRSRIPDPSLRAMAIGAVALVAGAYILGSTVEGLAMINLGYGVALGIVVLSLVPLTGYGGMISLAPLAFAGIGALTMYWWGADGNPLALVAVAAVCAVVGALVALPTLRLKGIYLALATMAFALFCEKAVFRQADQFKDSNAVYQPLFGIDPTDQRTKLVVLATIFAGLAVAVNLLRRSRFGRRLQAMKDSPAACATLGISTTRLKLEAFALSAAIAGVGGALLAGWRGRAGADQFGLLQGALPGLPLVLMAVVGGIAAAAGVLLGAFLLAMMPMVADTYPALRHLMTLGPGLAGVGLAANPNGIVSMVGDGLRSLTRRPAGEGPSPTATEVPEQIPLGFGTTPAQIAALDHELGLDWGRCDGDPRAT